MDAGNATEKMFPTPEEGEGMRLLARIVLPGRPWTMNAALRDSWQANSKRTRQIRTDSGWLWRQALGTDKLPPGLTVAVAVRTKDKRRQDTGAAMPAVKAVIDALIDIGAVPDDDPRYIRQVRFAAPEIAAGRNETEVSVYAGE